MARVLVAVPTFETVSPDTFKSLWDMDRGGNDVAFEFVRGYDCARARNAIAEKALDFDYVLMVDSDVTVPSDALTRLLAHGFDVAFGFYARRSTADGKTTLCKLSGDGYHESFTADELREMRESGFETVEVKGGGAGCMLVKSGVFGRLSRPWFRYVDYGDGSALSEDYYFCSQCRSAGMRLYADVNVGCGHLMRKWEGVM